ncbi:DUF2975 domain-containing protein [Labilibaculum sp. A4]|uniref:DUF2975 domain-containing protein n=1 Tax=Labilibaculum euxinus TaxID=2686357 RepID=UPI000F61C4E5|nr:DUF2975 domain-containing protein [Labilibaculum euxinus]MDQ1769857.1 DUF2975 domain-containing protein [Labilibaculum euxinus]MWN76413.1 DUF2975 domain-containing protein [Labilibaculum euxinus]
MKNSNRIIGFLYGLFNIVFFLSVLIGVVGAISGIVFLIVGDDIGLRLPFYSTVELQYSFSFLWGEHMEGVREFIVRPESIISSNIWFRIAAVLNKLILIGFFIFSVKQLKDIFNTLKEENREKSYFCKENYIRIRKLAFLILTYSVYTFVISFGFSVFLIEDFKVAGNLLQLMPDGLILAGVYKSMILFVVAEVYKLGLDMKNDAELTI